MADHRKRFEKWRARIPANTRYLVDQVLSQMLPEFEARGFKWHSDYAGGDMNEVAATTLPLQIRDGNEWPTVQICFAARTRPWFHVVFSRLPLICKRGDGEQIPRDVAIVVYAPIYFYLNKGNQSSYGGQFGYHYFSFFPQKRLDAEVSDALSRLPALFDILSQPIPHAWLTMKRGTIVVPNVRIGGTWHQFQEYKRRLDESSK